MGHACFGSDGWTIYTTVPEMFRDSGLAYRGTDDGGREVYCPVCLKYRAGDGHEVVSVFARPSVTRKVIARHLATKQALEEEQREATREVRRHRVGWYEHRLDCFANIAGGSILRAARAQAT
jgi:hypothetical protein